jgi:hypothetical protein
MFIENGAQKLVTYCAQLVRIFARQEPKFVDMWQPVLDCINDKLPRGSGFDSGSSFDINASRADRLVFNTSFHHMNDCGYYDGWSDHSVIVRPTFDGFDIRVTGRNRNDIKEHIGDMFHDILSDYVKTAFDREAQEMTLVPAQYDYGFNGPIVREN